MSLKNTRSFLLGTMLVCSVVLSAGALPQAQTRIAPTEPPKVGQKAADFTLSALDGAPVTLSTELARGPVVLIVSRGWVGYQCPFCNRQFGDFLKHAKEIEDAGARVIWVYPGPTEDVHKRAEEFAAGREFPTNFRLVLDPDYTFTVAYGLRWDAPQETAYPSTFVIDRGGVIRYALVSRAHAGRAPATDVIAALKNSK